MTRRGVAGWAGMRAAHRTGLGMNHVVGNEVRV